VVSRDHAAHSQLPDVLADRWGGVVEIPNGVDGERFNPNEKHNHVFDELALSPKVRLVLFVSPLDPAHWYRRLDLLIQALAGLDDPRIHLIVVGGGSWQKKYQRLAAQSGLGARVHFLGSIPHPELPPYYRAAEVLVLPSQAQESFGMTLIEAMACGTPVIASDLPGARSVVQDGIDGFLVQPGQVEPLVEKLNLVFKMTPECRSVMGLAGRQKVVDQYTWKNIISDLERLYLDIV
jgi:glycosyltransferase involved in cell wall biosynthesis